MSSVKFIDRTIDDLISRRVKKDSFTGCWNWTGFINPDGYGLISISHFPTRRKPVHRYFYEKIVGKVNKKLHVDHKCRNRACVNPSHLKPVTCRENVLGGIGLSAQNARKTHCKNGHPLSGLNLRIVNGEYGKARKCLTCSRKYERERHRKLFGWKPRVLDQGDNK